jgi:hypothetical protein
LLQGLKAELVERLQKSMAETGSEAAEGGEADATGANGGGDDDAPADADQAVEGDQPGEAEPKKGEEQANADGEPSELEIQPEEMQPEEHQEEEMAEEQPADDAQEGEQPKADDGMQVDEKVSLIGEFAWWSAWFTSRMSLQAPAAEPVKASPVKPVAPPVDDTPQEWETMDIPDEWKPLPLLRVSAAPRLFRRWCGQGWIVVQPAVKQASICCCPNQPSHAAPSK